MENNSFQTSFIPKKPITSGISDKEPKSLFTIISTFLLVVSIIIPTGLFFYRSYLEKQKVSLAASLLVGRDSFEKGTIDELSLFDKRIEVSKQVLSKHIILSPLFTLLGEITIPAIQYTNFVQQTNDKGFSVSIEGLARDYKSIAIQSNVFSSAKGNFLKNVLFYNLTKDKNNNISFNLKFEIDPSLLSYQNSITPNSLQVLNNSATNPLSLGLNNKTQ